MEQARFTPSRSSVGHQGLAAAGELARRILRQRRERDRVLGAAYFADPNWDMMLDLFAAQVAGEEVATSSLIVAACVSQSTALRRIRRLVRDGDLVARADAQDGRRTFLRLSSSLFEAIGLLLQSWDRADRDAADNVRQP